MKKFFKWLFIVLLLPVILVATGFYLNQKGFFNTQKIVVENTRQVHPEFYQSKLQILEKKLSKFTGAPLWKISLEDLQTEIAQLPWIESAQLTKQWPSELVLRLSLKTIPLVLYDQGLLHPILENGELLSPIPMNQSPDAVVVTGSQFRLKKEMREKTLEFLKQIPEEGSLSRKTIAEIRYQAKDGFWLSLIEQDIEVKMGMSDFNEKSQRVSQVLDYMSQHQIKARVIDADLSKKVLVRLRKGP